MSLFILRIQKFKIKTMGKFHHSKKHHGDKKKSSSSRLKFDLTQSGRRKLPEDFLYTQNHKSIWNSFSNFLDEKFAEEDLSEILDEDEVARIKTAPVTIRASKPRRGKIGRGKADKAARTVNRRQVLRRERSTVSRRNKETFSEVQSSNCASAQAHRCIDQP